MQRRVYCHNGSSMFVAARSARHQEARAHKDQGTFFWLLAPGNVLFIFPMQDQTASRQLLFLWDKL
jgi:hypothetical protein